MYHLFVAFDILLEDNLNGNLSICGICFSHNAIGASAESSAKLVLRSGRDVNGRDKFEDEGGPTFCHSFRVGHPGG